MIYILELCYKIEILLSTYFNYYCFLDLEQHVIHKHILQDSYVRTIY